MKTKEQFRDDLVAVIQQRYAEPEKDQRLIYRKLFALKQLTWVVDQLIYIGEEIRSYKQADTQPWFNPGGRANTEIMEHMLGAGQRLSSLLFCGSLRTVITDPIEARYGLDFSGLKIYPQVYHYDGSTAYVCYKPRADEEQHGRVSLIRFGAWAALSVKEYGEQYSDKPRNPL